MSGRRSRTAVAMVVLPAPEGPEITSSLGARLDPGADVERAPAISSDRLSLVELCEQRLFLLLAEPADTARRRNVQLLHDLLRAHLADAGKRFQHGRNLHLADRVVGRLREDLGQ